MMKKYKTIVADEAISEKTCLRFVSFLKTRGYDLLDIVFIAKEHPGMPDAQIVHHLLNPETIFLTADRPLHNIVLSQHLTSYYYTKNETFTDQKLKGIKTKHPHVLHKNDLEIKDSYHLPKTPIRAFLLPSSEKTLKKLRTKRRRIRNHFGGTDHFDQVMITVSWQSLEPSSTLFGIKVRVSSNIGVKALDASESYIIDNVPPDHRGIVALNFALIVSIQLMLHTTKTKIYFDSPRVSAPALTPGKGHSVYSDLFHSLYDSFSDLEFIPSTKGKFIERLRGKLGDLCSGTSNEIVTGNILVIIDALKASDVKFL